MKYLLGYLESINDAPRLSDPDFQQLLVDVSAGKAKSSDAFYDSLEKVVNELRSSPEAGPFLKPVSKRDAPDYFTFVKKPMDLSTVLRNVKTHKYKNKHEFGVDLDQIWENCLIYNSTPNHPLRAVAIYLRQKTNHHLEFLADRDDLANNSLASILAASGASAEVQRAVSRQPTVPPPGEEEEDAAGESDDAMGEDDDGRSKTGPTSRNGDPNGRAPPDVNTTSRDGRATSADKTSGASRANGQANGDGSPPPFRPNLQVNLELAPALLRTPYTMTYFEPVSLSTPGPSFSDKGKARDILYGNAPPAWYPASADNEDAKLEGYWWGATSKDEAYVAGLPCVPHMVQGPSMKRRRVRARSASPRVNGNGEAGEEHDAGAQHEAPTPALEPSKPLSIERVVHRAVDKLSDARKTMNTIQEYQRYVEGDGTDPEPLPLEPVESVRARYAEERQSSKRKRKEAKEEADERLETGGEVGEEEAAYSLKRASASLLAHAGFDGANDVPLDILTRVAGDYIRNLGRTFRLLLDGFGHQMDAQEIVLHALHENGQVELPDLEAHLKDDIERDSAKISEMQRKVRQAYKEMTAAPVIEDDMLLAADGQMLQHGDFAEDLGEDFLGLRELGIDKEFGLSSLSVPKSLFFGRRRRVHDTGEASKAEQPDFTPPPPFIPLSASTYKLQVPALFHAFYAERLEAGGLDADDAFDATHTTIGPLGQIVVKASTGAVAKKKKDEDKKDAKKPAKKTGQPGVGKGNWIRPSKEERERRAAEKKAELERRAGAADEDAEGEDE